MAFDFFKRFFKMYSDAGSTEAVRPSISISRLTFSDDSSISLGPDDIVLIVGPNNSGKSMALRQIEWNLAGPKKYNVISSCEVRKVGTPEALWQAVVQNSKRIFKYDAWRYVGYKFEIQERLSESFGRDYSEALRDFFLLRLGTDDRLSGSDPVKSIAYRREQPSHPMHLLVMDRQIEGLISESFRKSFGQNLYVNRAGGSDVELFVSDTEIRQENRDDFDKDAIAFFEKDAVPLKAQGDGMRAFTTVALNCLAISQQSVLLIDEPEAFLHPPQARLLGRMIADHGIGERQIFIATHSSDILKGILEVAGEKLRLLRITRNGSKNIVKSLDATLTKQLANDPLIRYSGIFDGIFFRHVVLCEADTDCQFYSAIMRATTGAQEAEPDVLFVQSSGKHRMAKLGGVAAQLGLPFSSIVDIDVLNDKAVFKSLTDAAGLPWNEIEPIWKPVYDAVNSLRVPLSASQLITSIEETVIQLKRGEINIAAFLSEIRDKVRSNSPWDNVKRSGRNALPMGDVIQKFDALLARCGEAGLWIVPEGELEGFCRSVKGRKGSNWIINLFESHDLVTSPELSEARSFVARLWQRAKAA